MECDRDKNIFGSLYHVKEPRTKIHDLPLTAAVQHLQQWNERGIMIKVSHLEHNLAHCHYFKAYIPSQTKSIA